MNPSIVVLADLTATAERIAAYAAPLGAALHAQLTLLHLYENPVLDPVLTPLSATQANRNQAHRTRPAGADRALARCHGTDCSGGHHARYSGQGHLAL